MDGDLYILGQLILFASQSKIKATELSLQNIFFIELSGKS